MKKSTLSPDLDLLCSMLCKKVLKVEAYQNLSNQDINKISAFLIRFNPGFSSSKESLNKNLQNWFFGKNSPSATKIEEIAKSLGYTDYHEFIQKNQRKIRANKWRQFFDLSPFQKAILVCITALIIALCFPLISGIPPDEIEPKQLNGSEFLISIIQAVVVVLFSLITWFSNFGGRDRIFNATPSRPSEVHSSLIQFFKGWKYLWLSFSALYIWLRIAGARKAVLSGKAND